MIDREIADLIDHQQRRMREHLTARIRTIHQASREAYGAPKVHVELPARRVPCCRNTVAKLTFRRTTIFIRVAVPKSVRRPQPRKARSPFTAAMQELR